MQYLDFELCTHYNLIGKCTIDEHYNLSLPPTDYIADLVKSIKLAKQRPKLMITLTPDNVRMSKIVSFMQGRQPQFFLYGESFVSLF